MVYIASSLQTYSTARYDANLHLLRDLFPGAAVLPARDLFASTPDWRRRWPSLLPTLAALVFFHDGDGFIGMGVAAEIGEVSTAGLPVWYLADTNRLYRLDEIEVWPALETHARFARVAYPVSVDEFVASGGLEGDGG